MSDQSTDLKVAGEFDLVCREAASRGQDGLMAGLCWMAEQIGAHIPGGWMKDDNGRWFDAMKADADR